MQHVQGIMKLIGGENNNDKNNKDNSRKRGLDELNELFDDVEEDIGSNIQENKNDDVNMGEKNNQPQTKQQQPITGIIISESDKNIIINNNNNNPKTILGKNNNNNPIIKNENDEKNDNNINNNEFDKENLIKFINLLNNNNIQLKANLQYENNNYRYLCNEEDDGFMVYLPGFNINNVLIKKYGFEEKNSFLVNNNRIDYDNNWINQFSILNERTLNWKSFGYNNISNIYQRLEFLGSDYQNDTINELFSITREFKRDIFFVEKIEFILPLILAFSII
jgi:hypothetical protein